MFTYWDRFFWALFRVFGFMWLEFGVMLFGETRRRVSRINRLGGLIF